MPRFENEDFDPKNRNREDIDRTVPKDEDYYNYSPEDIDLNFNSKKRENNIVVDNQRKPGNYGDYQQDSRGDITFKSETIDDFDRGSSSHQRNTRSTPHFSNGSRFGSSDRKNFKKGNSHNSSNKNKKHKSKNGKKAKSILAVILVLVILLVGSVFPVLARVNYDEKKADKYVTASDLKDDSSVKNILLLGVDARSNESAEQTRSDTMTVSYTHLTLPTNSIV